MYHFHMKTLKYYNFGTVICCRFLKGMVASVVGAGVAAIAITLAAPQPPGTSSTWAIKLGRDGFLATASKSVTMTLEIVNKFPSLHLHFILQKMTLHQIHVELVKYRYFSSICIPNNT